MKRLRNYFPCVCSVVCALVILLFGTVNSASAQSASTAKAFEVETVKPGAFDYHTYGQHIYPTRVTYRGVSLKALVGYAYGFQLHQIKGPDWTDSDYFNIDAVIPEGTPKQDITAMLQELLKRRFKLAFHIEKREGQVYELVVGKHGARLTPSLSDPSEVDPNAPLKPGEQYVGEGDLRHRETTNKDGSTTTDMGRDGTLKKKLNLEDSTVHWERSRITMADFAKEVSLFVQKTGGGMWTVVDRTGIKGHYQIAFDYKIQSALPQGMTGGGVASDPLDTGMLTRSLDALGLRLEKQKAQIDYYIIDHVEKPGAN